MTSLRPCDPEVLWEGPDRSPHPILSSLQPESSTEIGLRATRPSLTGNGMGVAWVFLRFRPFFISALYYFV